jgi:WD40 repeat protein
MRRAATLILVIILGLVEQVFAADLTKIDRTILKLPPLRTEHPEYCLLVFGPDAHKRVWLVQDGDVLYVDGNGDLTEPDERITADPEYGNPEEGVFQFKAGNLPDGKLLHKDLRVYTSNLSFRINSDPNVKHLLEANPKWRAHSIRIDVEIPGQRGGGFDGRVSQTAGVRDMNGLLQFAARPEDAPIIHFGAPWEITFYGTEDWHIGKVEEATLAVGTPGLGFGATAFVEFEGVIPLTVCPTAKITYPPAAADQAAIVKSYELTKRCCGINLYGNVPVPTDIGIGLASAELSLPRWPGTDVSGTTHTINIVPPKPPIKLDPVSWRIKGSLAHVNKGKSERGCTVEIQFSPDGKQLIAGDYDSGATVQTWDVASGQKLVAIAVGPGHPSNYEFFAVSPDWKFIYAPTIEKDRKTEKIEKDGKRLMRWTFGDSVQVFDLNTGTLLREFQSSPPRAINYIRVTPDGGHLITLDELSGEYENGPPSAWTLWNSQTGAPREFLDRRSGISLFSADGKTAVSVVEKSSRGSTHIDCLQVLNFPACTERVRIAPGDDAISVSPLAFSSDEKIIVGGTTTTGHHSEIKFWDATSGRELGSAPASALNERFGYSAKVSPDGKFIAIGNAPDEIQPEQQGGIYLVDVATGSARFLDIGKDVFPTQAAFHPTGKWVVAAANVLTKEALADPDLPYTDVPQPRLYVLEVASGKIVETLIAPQCFLNSLAFSPDGNTLATSGPGEVLLWDFSIPPGQTRPTTKR